jgi:beta-lactamase class A
MDELESAVRRDIEASGALRTAVAAGVVGGPRAVLVDADEVFHAASTMKVPVLVELYRRAWAGEVSLDEALPVRNAFRSLLDGSPYSLDPADDSETALYAREGDTETIRELARLMISVSSNFATNLLIDRLGAPAVEATVRGLGVEGVHVLRGVEDGPAFRAGLNNTVTAAGLGALLERIADGTAAPGDACTAMLDVLAQQEFNEGIPAGLPAGTRVAHKTGSFSNVYHDAAVVDPAGREPYVLVVLTQGLDETTDGPALVARISKLVDGRLGVSSR